MVYSSSQEQYEGLCKELNDSAPKQIWDYFLSNWSPIKSEWVLNYKAQCGSFLNSTNNTLESINDKLKQVISKK